MTTPNMGLTKPGVTGSVSPTAGPTYATQQNTDLDLLDAHDHTSGKGTQVPSAGININADLSYTGFGPINQSYSRYTPISAPGATINGGIFVVGTDLYYQTTGGVNLQLTSGNSVVSTGTGTYTGFYQFGGNGYAGSPAGTNAVQAGYDSTVSQYRFGNTNADPNASGTAFANAALGTLYLAPYTANIALVAGFANGGVGFTGWASKAPTGGWALASFSALTNTANTFHIGMDSAHNGVYTTWYPLRLAPLATSNAGIDFSAGLAINWGRNGKDASSTSLTDVPLHVGSAAYDPTGTPGVPYTIARFAGYTQGGVPVAGGGLRTIWQSAWASGVTNGYTVRTMGGLSAVWGGTPGQDGGINIGGARNGTLTATPGIQLMNIGGADYVGLGGIADSAYTGKIYGTLGITNGLVVIGGNSSFSGGNISTVGTINATVHLGGSFSGTTIAGSTGTFSSTVTGSQFVPSTTGAFVGGTGGIWKNTQVLAWGNYDAAGNRVDGYNVGAAVASITNTSMFNGTFGVNMTSSTTLAIIANVTAGSDASGAWTAQGQVTGAHTWSVCIYKNNTLTLPVLGFSFIVLGTP